MRVRSENGRLLIDFAESDKKSRGDFFYALSEIPFAEWLGDTEIAYDPTLFSERSAYLHMRKIQNAAKTYKAELTEDAAELIERYREKYEACEAARLEQEMRQTERRRAQTKLQHGCGFCESLRWDHSKRRYVCKESGVACETSMLETEMLLEVWKESGVFRRNTPFPNRECKYLEVMQ